MTTRAYVMGDFHLGGGPTDPLEDFHDDAAFARFCERVAGPDVTLILNGDVIDFVQIPPFDVPDAAHLLWEVEASKRKLATALVGHREFFAALAGLIQRGGTVIYTVGNHDLDVGFREVQDGLRAAVGADDSQLRFVIGAARYHGIHVEHGFQFTPENCPQDPVAFIHPGPGGKLYLERVWGTDFMLQFFNQLETSFPYADNVKPMLSLVWHGLKNGWIGGREVVRMLVFLKRRGVPWGAVAGATLAAPEPFDPGTVADSFEDAAWQEVIANRAGDPGFAAEMRAAAAELDRTELSRVVHDSVATVDAPVLGRAPESTTLGLFRKDREERAALDRLKTKGVTGVVFGHTHSLVVNGLDGRWLNHGTWLPSLDLDSPKVKARIDANGVTQDMLADHGLYKVERCAVRLDPDPPNATRMRIVPVEDP
jgi:UDP-2,3-diacylglucosamine pyrophosphatase LpxH